MKADGIVQHGPYAGQRYKVLCESQLPRWWRVKLWDPFADARGQCVTAIKTIRERCLQK